MENEHDVEEKEEYGDTGIVSHNAPIPRWLKINYIFWIIFGLCWFLYFWNGSRGWLDRGYWQDLQRAAQTTYPFDNEAYEGQRGNRDSKDNKDNIDAKDYKR